MLINSKKLNKMCSFFLILVVLFNCFACANIKMSSKRFGKDCIVFVSYPVRAPIASVLDSIDIVKETPLRGIVGFPLNFFCNFIKHTYATIPYVIDIPFYPFYVFYGAEPIKIYDLSNFPFEIINKRLISGGQRGERSAMGFICSPFAAFIAAGNDAYKYWISHKYKKFFITPILYPFQVTKHFLYGIKYGFDFILYPILLPLGLKTMEIYEWDKYPFTVKLKYNKIANRFYKSAEILISMPIGIPVKTTNSFRKSFRKNPGLTSGFAFILYPAYLFGHTICHSAYFMDLLFSPLYIFVGNNNMDVLELYITETHDVHPVEKSILAQRIAAFIIIMISTMIQAAAQQNYDNNPSTTNAAVSVQSHRDSIANAQTGYTYFKQANAMKNSLANVRGFYGPLTCQQFLIALDKGKIDSWELIDDNKKIKILKNFDDYTTKAVTISKEEYEKELEESELTSVQNYSLMTQYRNTMNNILYNKETKLLNIVKKKIRSKYGLIELDDTRIEQLKSQEDLGNLIKIMDKLMEAYILIPGEKGISIQSDDALSIICEDVLEQLNKEISQNNSPFKYMFIKWKASITDIKDRVYTQDAIINMLRDILVEGYIKIYDFQVLKK